MDALLLMSWRLCKWLQQVTMQFSNRPFNTEYIYCTRVCSACVDTVHVYCQYMYLQIHVHVHCVCAYSTLLTKLTTTKSTIPPAVIGYYTIGTYTPYTLVQVLTLTQYRTYTHSTYYTCTHTQYKVQYPSQCIVFQTPQCKELNNNDRETDRQIEL